MGPLNPSQFGAGAQLPMFLSPRDLMDSTVPSEGDWAAGVVSNDNYHGESQSEMWERKTRDVLEGRRSLPSSSGEHEPDYADILENGVEEPANMVLRSRPEPGVQLLNGHHRVAASVLRGDDLVPVRWTKFS